MLLMHKNKKYNTSIIYYYIYSEWTHCSVYSLIWISLYLDFQMIFHYSTIQGKRNLFLNFTKIQQKENLTKSIDKLFDIKYIEEALKRMLVIDYRWPCT